MRTWSINNINSLLQTMRHDREIAKLTWNKDFPPNIEVAINIDGITTPVTHGVWKVEDGVFIIAKSKNGYHPENKVHIPTKIIEAIRSII